MNGEIRAHARGTVIPGPGRQTEPDDQIEYDRAHDGLQQQGDSGDEVPPWGLFQPDDYTDESDGNG